MIFIRRCSFSVNTRLPFGMEEATKRKATAFSMPEAATKKPRATIPILPDDVILNIFRFLDTQDRIAFAVSCEAFRRVCVDESSVFRKTDLSRCLVSTAQRSEMNKFFRDRELAQHIRELNISNLRVLNWQIDDQLEEFILSCPHLEALHVLNCQMSLQRLCRILKQAPKLTAISWSLWDFTSEDIQFIVKSMESCEEICLKNIKHLHLELLLSKSHIQIAKYLLLSCFRDLEKLEICIWLIDMEYCTGWNLALRADQFIPGFPQPSVENDLQHLHSLMVVAGGGALSEIVVSDDDMYEEEPPFPTVNFYKKVLSDFVVSVVHRKSSSTKWKTFWILPSIGNIIRRPRDFSLLLQKDDFQSVEAITADAPWYEADELKTLFERIGDNTVRSLHLCFPGYRKLIVELCESILRVGGHALKFLSLSAILRNRTYPEENIAIHSLFSACMNITELDLFDCCFEKHICESLSKLKNLTKVQLMQCAICLEQKYENQVEILKANFLTFVENCRNITDLDVHGCERRYHFYRQCRLIDDDLLAVAKLRNLKSLTLYKIAGIKEWSFLKTIMENCKFLTMLRIRSRREFKNSHLQILMESLNFLQHVALDVQKLYEEGIGIGSDGFWNLLSHAKNLQRLCIMSHDSEWLDIPVAAVQTIKSLPRLHVLHLHSENIDNVEVFHTQMKRMLEEKESDCRFSFEIVTGKRRRTWINHQTGYNLISNKALPPNEAELCLMTPILDKSSYKMSSINKPQRFFY